MNSRAVMISLFALCGLAPLAARPALAANLLDYAKSAINERFLAEAHRPGIALAFVGATPPGDRVAASFALTPFVWVTNRPNRITDVADADLVIVHLRSFKGLATATDLDPRIAAVVQQNAAQLQQAGACTKITATRSGAKQGFVFLSLEDNDALRTSCLYGHVRALFGLREDGEAGEFADTFLADLTIARCISQMTSRQPPASVPGDAKTAIVQALVSGTCERGAR